MPLPVITNTYRVTFKWTGPSNLTAANVLHFFASGGGSAAALYTALDTNANASMWQTAPATCAISTVNIIKLDGTSGTISNGTGSPAKWAGQSGAAPEVIPQVATLIKLTTGQRGPAKRGRLFLPFVQESASAQGQLQGTYAANVQAAWRTWQTALNTAGYALCVASYAHASQVSPVTITCEQFLATQRRRQGRIRP